MKATELRIGNLVDLGNRIAKVIDIGHLSCTVVDLGETQDTLEDYERTQGIPLTEEWLDKFGFDIKDKDRLDWVKGAFNLERSNEDNNKFCFEVYSHYIPLDYVHQLQNLYFALTGEELILKES